MLTTSGDIDDHLVSFSTAPLHSVPQSFLPQKHTLSQDKALLEQFFFVSAAVHFALEIDSGSNLHQARGLFLEFSLDGPQDKHMLWGLMLLSAKVTSFRDIVEKMGTSGATMMNKLRSSSNPLKLGVFGKIVRGMEAGEMDRQGTASVECVFASPPASTKSSGLNWEQEIRDALGDYKNFAKVQVASLIVSGFARC